MGVWEGCRRGHAFGCGEGGEGNFLMGDMLEIRDIWFILEVAVYIYICIYTHI